MLNPSDRAAAASLAATHMQALTALDAQLSALHRAVAIEHQQAVEKARVVNILDTAILSSVRQGLHSYTYRASTLEDYLKQFIFAHYAAFSPKFVSSCNSQVAIELTWPY